MNSDPHPLASAAYGALPLRELGVLAVQGNEDAFKVFMQRRMAAVSALCRRVIGPAGDFESVAAEAFAELWLQRGKIAHPERAQEWLSQTAFNLACDYLKAHRRALGAEVLRGWWQTTGAGRKESLRPFDASDDFEDELKRLLREAINRLPDRYRQPLLVRFECNSDQEAAKKLKLNVRTLRTRLHRAAQKVRENLRDRQLVGGAVVGTTLSVSATKARGWLQFLWKPRLAKVSAALAGLLLIASMVWYATRGSRTSVPQSVPEKIVIESTETLAEKNLRLFRANVLDELPIVAKGLAFGSDGRAEVIEHSAVGSEITFSLRITHNQRSNAPVSLLKLRYCVEERRLAMEADLWNKGVWKKVDPDRPIVLINKQNPLSRVFGEVIIRPKAIGEIETLLLRVPDDGRARAEVTSRYAALRKQDGRPWPAGVFHAAGNDRWLYCVTGEGRLLFRRKMDDPDDVWECLCRVSGDPVLIAATNEWLYAWNGVDLRASPADAVPPTWMNVGPMPDGIEWDSAWSNGLGATESWLVYWEGDGTKRPYRVWIREATGDRRDWKKIEAPGRLQAVAGGRFVIVDDKPPGHLLARRIDEPNGRWIDLGEHLPTGWAAPLVGGAGRRLVWWDLDGKRFQTRAVPED